MTVRELSVTRLRRKIAVDRTHAIHERARLQRYGSRYDRESDDTIARQMSRCSRPVCDQAQSPLMPNKVLMGRGRWWNWRCWIAR